MMAAQPCKYIKALRALSHFMLQKPLRAKTPGKDGIHM